MLIQNLNSPHYLFSFQMAKPLVLEILFFIDDSQWFYFLSFKLNESAF
jgi:hypothetical protein